MWDIFKLIKHKDGTYRCRNGLLDILFLTSTILLLIPVAVFSGLGHFFEKLLGIRQ